MPDSGARSYTVVGTDALPVWPAEEFLTHLMARGSSPNTVEGYAYDLWDFFEWLAQRGWDFRALSLEQLSEFFVWLRRPWQVRRAGVYMLPGTPPAVEQSTLLRKRSALASFYRAATRTPYAQALFDSLPVLGKSGTLANVLPDSPAAGHAQVKTGNRVVGTPAGQMIVLGNSLAGYIQAKSGRQVTFMIAVGNVPISSIDEFLQITDDQARMVAAIQQSL